MDRKTCRDSFETVEQTLAKLQTWSQGSVPFELNRVEIRNLCNVILDAEAEELTRASCLKTLYRSESPQWRDYFALWKHLGPELPGLVSQLVAGIEKNKSNFERRKPAWLSYSLERGTKLLELLQSPGPCIAKYIEEKNIPIYDVAKRLDLSSQAEIAARSLSALIRDGDERWWRSHSPESLENWASQKASLGHCSLVAERFLLEFDLQAPRAANSEDDPGIRLVKWIERRMGTPHARSGVWDPVCVEARRCFQKLSIRREFSRVISVFRKYADANRANYWAKWEDYLDDAIALEGLEHIICLMRFANILVVEVGVLNNSCYLYKLPGEFDFLQDCRFDTYERVDQFKSKSHIMLQGVRLPLVKRMSHHRGWEEQFTQSIAHYAKIKF